jgi:hypothetical protein
MLWGEGTMRKWWTTAALAAMWLGQTAVSTAQAPGQMAGAGYMPEPVPISGPGAANPLIAPPGYAEGQGPMPGPGMAHEGEQGERSGMYFSVGASALRRQRLGHLPLVVIDTASNGLDTGVPPALGATTLPLLNLNLINPNYIWGPSATVGFQSGSNALELSGFWLPDQDHTTDIQLRGLLDLPFFNPPLGFEGDNGLWLQADRVSTSFRSAIGNAEINGRHWSESCPGLQGIYGVRYLDLQERFAIFTGDDDLTFRDINGFPDPVRQATYFTRAHSHIIAPQLGFEYDIPFFSWFTIALTGKGAWGINFYEVQRSLKRGDGFIGFDQTRSASTFSHMYEIGAFGDIGVFDRIHFRAGYSAFWVLHVPEATSQIDFNLRNVMPTHKDDGSIFYHGPTFQVELFF